LFGHAAIMNKGRRVKQVMNWDPGGKGEDRGRIGVENTRGGLRGLGLTWEDALDAVEDRDGWRKCIARRAALHGKD